MTFLVRTAVNSLAIWLTTLMLPGMAILHETDETWKQVAVVLIVGAIFTAVNLAVKPIVMVLSIPFLILTLGLFYFVVNALMLLLTGWISDLIGWGLWVQDFGWALLGGIIISIIAGLLNIIAPAPSH